MASHENKEQTDSDQMGAGWGVVGERRGGDKSRNMYRGPIGMDNGVGIDCGSGGQGMWMGQGRATEKNVGQL